MLISGATDFLSKEFALATASAGAHLVLGDLSRDPLNLSKAKLTLSIRLQKRGSTS